MDRMTNIVKSARPINMAYQHLADKKAQYYYSWVTFYRIQNKWKILLQEHSYFLAFAEIYCSKGTLILISLFPNNYVLKVLNY
jgi:hypothetical protein